jgi:hypothetical protein
MMAANARRTAIHNFTNAPGVEVIRAGLTAFPLPNSHRSRTRRTGYEPPGAAASRVVSALISRRLRSSASVKFRIVQEAARKIRSLRLTPCGNVRVCP